MRSRPCGGTSRLALAALIVGAAWSAVAAELKDGIRVHADAPVHVQQTGVDSPDITFVDAASPTCSHADLRSGTCIVEWSSLFVTAGSGQYITSMSVEIGGRIRAHTQGFFQTYMYLPSNVFGPGFEVPCGTSGVGGVAGLGNLHGFVVRAKQSDGATTSSSGTFYCPFATLPLFSDGFESGDASAWSAHLP